MLLNVVQRVTPVVRMDVGIPQIVKDVWPECALVQRAAAWGYYPTGTPAVPTCLNLVRRTGSDVNPTARPE